VAGSDLDQGAPGERILSDLVFARGRLAGSPARRAAAQGGGTPPPRYFRKGEGEDVGVELKLRAAT
jgi:hypothetical protein